MLMAEAETEAETEADTEAEAMMREKAEGIEGARAEEEEKSRTEDDMIKKVWREKSLGAEMRGSSLRRKAWSVRLKQGPRQKLIQSKYSRGRGPPPRPKQRRTYY